jgi:hypothetical protein
MVIGLIKTIRYLVQRWERPLCITGLIVIGALWAVVAYYGLGSILIIQQAEDDVRANGTYYTPQPDSLP